MFGRSLLAAAAFSAQLVLMATPVAASDIPKSAAVNPASAQLLYSTRMPASAPVQAASPLETSPETSQGETGGGPLLACTICLLIASLAPSPPIIAAQMLTPACVQECLLPLIW